jgi:hypothetical protein
VRSVNTLRRGIGIVQIYPEDRHELGVISISHSMLYSSILKDLLNWICESFLWLLFGLRWSLGLSGARGDGVENHGLQEYGMV